jgi:hypothetical protein
MRKRGSDLFEVYMATVSADVNRWQLETEQQFAAIREKGEDDGIGLSEIFEEVGRLLVAVNLAMAEHLSR